MEVDKFWFIEKYIDKINWAKISGNTYISFNFFCKYYDKIS
jgi:hypothetical protein